MDLKSVFLVKKDEIVFAASIKFSFNSSMSSAIPSLKL
jgi:hypothetical protein